MKNGYGAVANESSPPPNESYVDLVDAEPNYAPQVVPVCVSGVVAVEPRAARNWTVGRFTLTPDNPVCVSSAHPARSRLVFMVNTGTDAVYIAPTAPQAPSGARVPPGQVLEMLHRDAVWATVATGSAEVSVAVEFLDG